MILYNYFKAYNIYHNQDWIYQVMFAEFYWLTDLHNHQRNYFS